MTLVRSIITSLSFFIVQCAASQFIAVPPLQNGIITVGEYGNTVLGTNRQWSSGTTWYCTWDASNLYIGISGSTVNEAAVLYFDVDPTIPVNGGGNAKGSVQWAFDYDRTKFRHPIRSDFGLYLKNGYHEFRYKDGTGEWTAETTNTLTVGSNFTGQVIEIRIPWNTMTNGNGRPAAFNWFGYKVFTNGDLNNGTYAQVPTENPITPNNAGVGAFNVIYPTYYYSVINTDNLTSTPPFAVRSFTYHQDFSAAGTGGYYFANQTVFDLTINDNSTTNADNASAYHLYNNNEISNRLLIAGNVTVNRNLVIWTGSALLPADNTSGNVNAILTMDGSSGKIYNEGRIDSNPEVGGLDHQNRRISWVFDGNTTYQNSSVFKELTRFSNITVNTGKAFRGPDTGDAQLELQYGTLTNNGLLQMNGTSGGYLDLGTRGDVTSLNTYLFSNPNATGTFNLHDMLIGRFSSKLAPAPSGGTVNLILKGNFENYGEFQGSETGGFINVTMQGSQRQEIIGNSAETVGSKTVFNSLVINNDNTLSNGNTGADVHFVTNGGGQISYYVKGNLQLLSGDLVTRDRSNSTIVHRLQVDDTGVIMDALAKSNIGTAPSSFVEGPMYSVIKQAQDSLVFPVGKDGSLRRMAVRAYQNTYVQDTLKAELFHSSANSLGYTVNQVPETILNISQVHWWRLENAGLNSLDSLRVTMEYGVNGSNDAAPVATDLRVMHAPINTWFNRSPSIGGSADNTGYVRSNKLTSYGWFTLGNTGGNPLPVELLDFKVKPEGEKAMCSWSTATELNNDYFSLEHSSDGLNFQNIGRIEGAGNSSSQLSYSFAHENPVDGWNYYRLGQVDFDGSKEELGLRSAWYNMSGSMSIYPNPVQDFLTISAKGQDWMHVEIWDGTGRKLKEYTMQATLDKLYLGDLSAGSYFIRCVGLSESFLLPFMKD